MTSMDSVVDAANLITGVWVETVAAMGTGAVEVGVVGMGLASNLTLNLLLSSMVLLLLSLVLGLSWSWGLHFGGRC